MSDGLINLLIVDDKTENLLILEGFLETIECNIIVARSGNEALDFMQKYDFALVRNQVYYEENLIKTNKVSPPKKVAHSFLEKQLREFRFQSVVKQKLSSANF